MAGAPNDNKIGEEGQGAESDPGDVFAPQSTSEGYQHYKQSDRIPKHFAALISHGSRTPHSSSFEFLKSIDLPLSSQGIKEATATGKYLKRYFEREFYYDFDKIIIECSPFLSCMITAAHIAKALGCKEVLINFRATQVLQPS